VTVGLVMAVRCRASGVFVVVHPARSRASKTSQILTGRA